VGERREGRLPGHRAVNATHELLLVLKEDYATGPGQSPAPADLVIIDYFIARPSSRNDDGDFLMPQRQQDAADTCMADDKL
jgi:hypothetical protein